MPRSLPLLLLATVLATGTARADCELLYAPPEVRARLLAFHHANELRRAREQARSPVADVGDKPVDSDPARPDHVRATPPRRPAGPR